MNSAMQITLSAIAANNGIFDRHSDTMRSRGAIAILKDRPRTASEDDGTIVFLCDNVIHTLNAVAVRGGRAEITGNACSTMPLKVSYEGYANLFNTQVGPNCWAKDTRLDYVVKFEAVGGVVAFEELYKETEETPKEIATVVHVDLDEEDEYVGKFVGCQLGNEEDTRGYCYSAHVKVLAVRKDTLGYPVYLVDTGKMYALATKRTSTDELDPVLISTNGLPYKFDKKVQADHFGFPIELFTKAA